MSKFKFLFSLLFIVYCANIVCQTNHTLIDCNPVFNYDIPPHVSADPHPCNTPYIAFHYTQTSQIPGNSISGNYEIYQDLVIDKDFKFSNCKLRIQPNVKITILFFKKLEIEYSHLFTCNDDLWKGIEVNSFGSIKILYSLIEDAEKVVFNSQTAYTGIYDITYSTFSNNENGIYFSSISGYVPQLTMSNTTINCTRPVKRINDIGYSGIFLKNSLFRLLGLLGSNLENKCTTLKYGIKQEGKFLPIELEYMKFSDIRIIGISCDEAFLEVNHSIFENCKEGINCFSVVSLNLGDNYFQVDSAALNDFTTFVIYKDLKTSAIVDIKYNHFILKEKFYKQSVKAIFQHGLIGPSSKLKINHNYFIEDCLNSGSEYSGIRITSHTPASATYDIEYNEFFFRGVCSAILTQGNQNNFVFNENIIQQKGRGTFILSEPCQFESSTGFNNFITHNIIPRRYLSPDTLLLNLASPAIGIHQMTNTTVCGNILYDNYQAFKMLGNCRAMNFSANFSSFGTFLEMFNYCVISNQFHKGNIISNFVVWTPTALQNDSAYAESSRFTVHRPQSTATDYNPYFPRYLRPLIFDQSRPNEHWWTYDPSGEPEICPVVRGLTNNIDSILVNNGHVSFMLDEEEYYYKLLLYESLKREGEVYNSNLIETFLQNVELNTQIDNFTELKKDIFDPPISNSITSAISSLINEIEAISQDSIGIVEYNQIFQLSNQLELKIEEANLAIQNSHISSLATVQSIFPSNPVEEVMKTYFYHYLLVLTSNMITPSQVAILNSLANKCSRKYGVFPEWAKLLVPACERINTLEEDCSGNSLPLQRKSDVSSISGVKDGYYSLSGIYLGKNIKENVNAVYIHIQDGKSIKVFIDPTHSKLD